MGANDERVDKNGGRWGVFTCKMLSRMPEGTCARGYSVIDEDFIGECVGWQEVAVVEVVMMRLMIIASSGNSVFVLLLLRHRQKKREHFPTVSASGDVRFRQH